MVSKSAGRQAADPSNHLCISYPSADMPRRPIHQRIEILNTQGGAGIYAADKVGGALALATEVNRSKRTYPKRRRRAR